MVAALLGLHVVLAFIGVLNRSVTNDETGHLTAGYTYWKFGDYRLQPENGNLPQRWCALPLLIAQPQLDPSIEPEDWETSRVWNVGQTFLFESGNSTDFLLLCARSMMLCWSIAAGLLVFYWARAAWGDSGGIGALALFAVSPTTLAHGPLATSDMCAAFCLLAALAAWWRMCLRPNPISVVIAGVALGLAFVAKFSAVLLLPVLVGLGLIAIARSTDKNTRTVIGTAAVALAIAGLVIWSFFGFRFSAANPSGAAFRHFYIPWQVLHEKEGLWKEAIQFARHWRLMPEAVLYGLSFVAYFSAERGAFLAGNYSTTGWWWFFPFAFLVKSTLGELLTTVLLSCGAMGFVRRMRLTSWRELTRSPILPLALFVLIFSGAMLTSKLNIGQRHILPLYLVLFIAAGALFSARAPRFFRVLGAAALLLSAVESVSNQPNHLAFFNQLAGGPKNGWRLLVDSSLDWGQDVSALAAWVKKNQRPNEPVYVSCFGTADPEYEGLKAKLLSPYWALGKPRSWYELTPGLYCLSATMLQDVYGIRPGPWTAEMEKDFQHLEIAARINVPDGTWSRRISSVGHHPEEPLWLLDRLRFARLCEYLKVRKPDAVINHTQFVFRLSKHELDVFSNRPFSALAALMQSASEQPTAAGQ